MSDTLELKQAVPDTESDEVEAAPPPFEGVKWRIKIGDKEYGPYPRTRLIDFLKEGRVQAGTFIACGTEDYLLKSNRQFAGYLRANGVDITYEEGPGGHDWDFWDAGIERVLNWLPLQKVPQPAITDMDVHS